MLLSRREEEVKVYARLEVDQSKSHDKQHVKGRGTFEILSHGAWYHTSLISLSALGSHFSCCCCCVLWDSDLSGGNGSIGICSYLIGKIMAFASMGWDTGTLTT